MNILDDVYLEDFMPEDHPSFIDLSETFVVIEKESDYLSAIKEVLWKLDNNPSNFLKIISHIAKKDNNDDIHHLQEQDYPIILNVLNKAVFNCDLVLDKTKKYRKIALYKNPTNKRKGYFYKGNLLSLKELSEINGTKIVTIQRRLSKGLKAEQAIQNRL